MRTIRVGWTGTQKGMTQRQKDAFRLFLERYRGSIESFHHGDCIGADKDAHDIAVDVLGVDRIWIHPPSKSKKRAFCKSLHILPEQDYLDRNHEIVDVTDCLLAAPETESEVLRSGTWATIRYAKRARKPVRKLKP